MARDHILSNGYTFLAITTGGYGTWAKATDPLTAIRNAAANNGYGPKGKVAIQVWYGKNDSLGIGHYGGITWQDHAPTPIGLFLVTKTSIKPMPKGAFNDKHEDCAGWMNSNLAELAEFEKAIAA